MIHASEYHVVIALPGDNDQQKLACIVRIQNRQVFEITRAVRRDLRCDREQSNRWTDTDYANQVYQSLMLRIRQA